MTTQLPIPKERLKEIAEDCFVAHGEIKAMARALLATYEQEPFGYVSEKCANAQGLLKTATWELFRKPTEIGPLKFNTPLYIHPAPSIPADLHPDTQKLVADFSIALAEKLYKAQLKYGYSDNWTRDGWAEECLQHFHQHISKGDPRDVAAYCAFMWFHGWSTALPAPSIPAVPEDDADLVKAMTFLRETSADAQMEGWLKELRRLRAAMLNGGKSERDKVRAAHAEWSQKTFGNVGPVGPLKHLAKEAIEAADAPDDLSEWADMQFLLWDAQRRAGITDEQINQAMLEKLAVNKAREWPEQKDGEPRMHIQSAPKV